MGGRGYRRADSSGYRLAPFQTRRATSELALPKTDPRVERKVHIMRRAEEMCMVRHQDVANERPFASFAPDVAQTSMGLVADKPQFAIFRWNVGSPSPHKADREEDDGRLAKVDMDAMSRVLAPDGVGRARFPTSRGIISITVEIVSSYWSARVEPRPQFHDDWFPCGR